MFPRGVSTHMGLPHHDAAIAPARLLPLGSPSGAAEAPGRWTMRRTIRAAVAGVLCGLVLAAGGPVALAAGGPELDSEHRINVNTASAQELARLPGIGPAKAEAIVQHRA